MDPERTFVHNRIGPSAGDQLVLVDRLAGALNKRDEDVQSPAAEVQRLPVLEQHALRGDQLERSEGESFLIHREIVLMRLLIHAAREKFSNAVGIRHGVRRRALGTCK